MQQQPSSISELIRLLRHFGARPALYIQPVDVQNAQSFLGGRLRPDMEVFEFGAGHSTLW